MRSLWVSKVVVAVAAACAATHAGAQSLPRQVTFVVPFAAGGSTDALARQAANRISSQSGANVVVENRGGAGGYTGSEYVSRAPADGSVILVAAFESLHSEIFTKNLSTVLTKALVPIVAIGQAPHIIVAPATLPVKTMKEFVAYVRANPGKLNAGVVSNNAVLLEALTFLKQQGLEMAPIPFNGGAATVTSMLRGELHFYMGSVSVTKQHVESGRLIALAIAGAERFPLVPQVPTTKELGINFEAGATYGLLAPAGMPGALVNQVHKMIVTTDGPQNRELLAKIGYVVPPPATPEALQAKFLKQNRDLKEAAASAGIQPQ